MRLQLQTMFSIECDIYPFNIEREAKHFSRTLAAERPRSRVGPVWTRDVDGGLFVATMIQADQFDLD